MKKILISPASFGQINNHAEMKLKQNGFQIIKNQFGRKLLKSELDEILTDRNIVGSIAGLELYDKETLKASNLEIISRLGSGLDNIDLNAARDNKISICSTPDGPINSVAELTLGMMIYLSRNILAMNNDMKLGKWKRIYGNLLEGKNISLIGFGRIGKRVYDLLKPFNCNVYIVDPALKKGKYENILTLEEALPISDIISFHLSSNKEIISDLNIQNLKKGVILLNSARGNIINERSLIYGIENNIVSSSWIDVFEVEPYQGNLKNYENVLLTPHIGSLTIESRLKMEDETVQNIIKYYI